MKNPEYAERALSLAVQIFTLSDEIAKGAHQDQRGIALGLVKHEDPRVVGSALQFICALAANFISVEEVIRFKTEILEELENRE